MKRPRVAPNSIVVCVIFVFKILAVSTDTSSNEVFHTSMPCVQRYDNDVRCDNSKKMHARNVDAPPHFALR